MDFSLLALTLVSRHRLRENYKVGKNGSVSKNSVFQHYYDACQDKGIEPVISATYFGKLVKRAFPGIKYNRFAFFPSLRTWPFPDTPLAS
jgi:hypothetical protein